MEKIRISTLEYPFPLVMVGAIVDGRPNFAPVGLFSAVGLSPPMIMISLGEKHQTTKGIEEKREFSVSIISESMMEKADYCGLVSGRDVDKSKVFEVDFRDLRNAPLIREAPLSAECRVTRLEKEGDHVLIIGEVVGAYMDPKIATKGQPDPAKMKPLFLTMPDRGYWTLGERVGEAWSVGKKLKR